MKDNIRRIILFAVIVGTGTVLIVFNVPLIFLIPLILAVGFILLLLLGAITVSDLRAGLSRVRLKNLTQRLSAIKFPGRKNAPLPVPVPAKPEKATGKPMAKIPEKPTGIRQHLESFVTSVRSIGLIIQDRGKHTKKVEDIDKMLDRTVMEKVKGSALASAGAMPGTSAMPAGGAGAMAGQSAEQDPFLSLSGEELEAGLLDALDENEPALPPAAASGVTAPDMTAEAAPVLDMPDLEMPPLPDDIDVGEGTGSGLTAEAAPVLDMPDLEMPPLPDDIDVGEGTSEEGGATGLAGLETGEAAVDESLGELDSINIEDVDLGEDTETEEPASAQQAATKPAPSPGSSSSLIPPPPIAPPPPSDLIPKAKDSGLDQAEMASFAAASGSDDDMMSSLASEIKHVKKEKDLSLLRELRDFKAPASEIEKDLKDLYDRINAAKNEVKKRSNPSGGIK
jgi:hypothetical protein